MQFLDTLTNIITFINDNVLWGIPMVLLILGVGIFMTVKTRALQVRKFKHSLDTTIVPTVKDIFKGKEKVASTVFSVIFVLLIVVGAVTTSDFVWSLDDMFNALMAIPNLIGVLGLSGMVVKITKNYFDRKKGLDVEPMLSYSPELNKEFAEELKQQNEE